MLGFGAFEAVLVHRVARFAEAGFPVPAVAAWAAASGLLSIPGRYALPALGARVRPTTLLAGVLGVLAAATALAVHGTTTAELAGHFLLWGLVFGSALPCARWR